LTVHNSIIIVYVCVIRTAFNIFKSALVSSEGVQDSYGAVIPCIQPGPAERNNFHYQISTDVSVYRSFFIYFQYHERGMSSVTVVFYNF
jgi:hypothetical protein